MSAERVERRLAAILAADVAGYSRLMGRDEAGTLARLNALRRELIDPKVAEHKGRIVKTTGDGLLIEFPSVVEAVACALAVQQGTGERNAGTPQDQRIEFRIGINSGDVIVEDGDIHGDGVNIAARLEGITEPGAICVSAIVQSQVEGRVDCAFEDQGEQNLKNIARPVRVYRVGARSPHPNPPPPAGEGERGASALNHPPPLAGEGRVGAAEPPALALPDKPSIAVLPFQNMSGDPEQEYFADGMVEEIITALSRIRWLFVIARNSSFTYKGQAVDVKRVGRELGVRYVLEGSVRKGGGRVRITAQLIEAETGAHLWADRFDGSLEDVFELQDQVATSVAGVIEPALQAAETARSARRPTSDLTAYDLYLRALPILFRGGKEDILEAARLLDQAISRDPRYGAALVFASLCQLRLAFDGWAGDPVETEAKSLALARRALEAAANDPVVLANSAFALAHFADDIATATALVDRAIALNPSYARGWYASGSIRLFARQPDIAIEHIEKSLRLSPRDQFGTPMGNIGLAHFLGRRFDLAAEYCQLQIRQKAGLPWPYRVVAASCAHLGRLGEARESIAQLRAIGAPLMASGTFLRNPEAHQTLTSGLRLAMGEAE